MLTPVLLWLAALTVLGWLNFPACFVVFRRLRDRGLALSKLAGVFVTTYAGWLVCHGPAAHTRSTLLVIIAGLAVLNGVVAWQDRRAYGPYFRLRWRYVLTIEAVFWLGLLAAGLVRAQVPAIAYDPNWWGAEKWSDYALLSSLCRQSDFPAQDPWLAGYPINYYYFGHLCWATLAKLTAIPPNIAYNLSLATIVALALILCMSLGYHLFRSTGLGFLLALLVVLGGNVKPALQLHDRAKQYRRLAAEGIAPGGRWDFIRAIDFWDGSRAMDWSPAGLVRESEINEIPSFSFILGDLHPHFSSHPLFLGFLLLLAALWRAGQRLTFSAHEILFKHLSLWCALAFVLGLLYVTNTWDFLVALFLATVVLPFSRGIRQWPAWGRLGLMALVFVGTALVAKKIVVLPFDSYFAPPKAFSPDMIRWWPPGLEGSPLAIVPPELRSSIWQWLFYFGLFVAPFLAWQAWEAAKRTPHVPLDRRFAWVSVALAAGLTAGVEGQSRLLGILAFLLIALIPGSFQPRRRERLQFVSILFWFGLGLALLCELFYYDDAFAGADERINTIFKIYYCLWPIMALAAVGACAALWAERGSPFLGFQRSVAIPLVSVMVAVGALYPLLAWTTRIERYRESEIGRDAAPTLDGLKYLESIEGIADDYKAARWLRENAPPDTIIAEAYDWGYSPASRLATLAGIQTLVGWTQHESVWRESLGAGVVAGRMTDVDDLYTTHSVEAALVLLAANRIDYVAVGTLERKYPVEGLAKFEIFFRPAFRSGRTTIYPFSQRARGRLGEGREP